LGARRLPRSACAGDIVHVGGPKAAAFAVFLRVFMTAFERSTRRWEPFVWSSALLTMVIGISRPLSQTNIKRLLAYSSIAHAAT